MRSEDDCRRQGPNLLVPQRDPVLRRRLRRRLQPCGGALSKPAGGPSRIRPVVRARTQAHAQAPLPLLPRQRLPSRLQLRLPSRHGGKEGAHAVCGKGEARLLLLKALRPLLQSLSLPPQPAFPCCAQGRASAGSRNALASQLNLEALLCSAGACQVALTPGRRKCGQRGEGKTVAAGAQRAPSHGPRLASAARARPHGGRRTLRAPPPPLRSSLARARVRGREPPAPARTRPPPSQRRAPEHAAAPAARTPAVAMPAARPPEQGLVRQGWPPPPSTAPGCAARAPEPRSGPAVPHPPPRPQPGRPATPRRLCPTQAPPPAVSASPAWTPLPHGPPLGQVRLARAPPLAWSRPRRRKECGVPLARRSR